MKNTNMENEATAKIKSMRACLLKTKKKLTIFLIVDLIITLAVLFPSVYFMGRYSPQVSEHLCDVFNIAQAVLLIVFVCVYDTTEEDIDLVCKEYECKKCGHVHTATKKELSWKRSTPSYTFLRCPNCEKASWHKKLSAEK